MLHRLTALIASIRDAFRNSTPDDSVAAPQLGATIKLPGLSAFVRPLIGLAIVGAAGWYVAAHPPVVTVGQGEAGIRGNRFTGEVTQWRDGSVLVVPGLHEMRVFSMRDQSYRPVEMARAEGPAPLQSREGLSLGVDLSLRYALDPARLRDVAGRLPEDLDTEILEPAVRGVIYKEFAKYTVREIFSSQRPQILQAVERELTAKLAADGIVLRSIVIGKVDLPADYKRGMDQLLAEELASEKMRYTLELKDKRVQEVALDGEAEKTRREKTAEALAREQVIAAKAQEEAMKHVLPFKQRQVEQRQLEAEAEKQARIRGAEGNASARKIEAGGEAEARQKLADAEAYRLERVGKANADQMEREGMIVTRHPLLIQKSMAERLSDKVQVIIAPPTGSGDILSAALLGKKP